MDTSMAQAKTNIHDAVEATVQRLGEYFVNHVMAARCLDPKLDPTVGPGYEALRAFLRGKVSKGLRIDMVLPAFPSKTNTPEKAIGDDPDCCEFMALKRMANVCREIGEIYEPGAHLTIFSDYHTFCKYIHVSCSTHYNYRRGLEELIQHLDATSYIKVMSLKDFPEFRGKEEEDYQEILRETFGSREFEAMVYDPKAFTAKMKESQRNDDKFHLNYSGLKQFMLGDQGYYLRQQGYSDKDVKAMSHDLAIGMMVMGKALTPFLARYFPVEDYLRLSIHAHPFDGKKNAVLLLPANVRCKAKTMNTSSLGLCTPWHTAACFNALEGRFHYKPAKDHSMAREVAVPVCEELKPTLYEIFKLLDTNDNDQVGLNDFKDVLLHNVQEGPDRRLHEAIFQAAFADIIEDMGQGLEFDDFLTCLENPKVVELLVQLLPRQLERAHHLTPHQKLKFDKAWAKLKNNIADTVLLTVTYNDKPWMLLRLGVDPLADKVDQLRHRLSSAKVSMVKPGFGLVIQAGPCGLFKEDILPANLDNLRIEFGCVVLRGCEKPCSSKDDLVEFSSHFGFPVPFSFGPVHVVTPYEKPPENDDVHTKEGMAYHFDLMFPPPYMGIDQDNFSYSEFIPGNFMLYCHHAPPPGEGQTTICDTEAVFNSLPPAIRKKFRDIEIKYSVREAASYYGGNAYTYPLVMNDPEKPGRTILRCCTPDENMGRLLTFAKAPDNLDMSMDDVIETLFSRIGQEKCTIYHSYQQGDIVIVNNHRALHARTAFSTPGHARELWRVQIIPCPEKIPHGWEEAILSEAIKTRLESGQTAWAIKLIQEATDRGFNLQHGAWLSLFRWMKDCEQCASFRLIKGCLCCKGAPVDRELAMSIISLQHHIPVSQQATFTRWLAELLREGKIETAGEDTVALLWSTALKAARESDELSDILHEISPISNDKIPKNNMILAAAIDLYAKMGDIVAIDKLMQSVQKPCSKVQESYTAALASCGDFDRAIKFAHDTMVLEPPDSRRRSSAASMLAMAQDSAGQIAAQTAKLYSVLLNEAANEGNTKQMLDIIDSFPGIGASMPLAGETLAKVLDHATMTNEAGLLIFVKEQLAHHKDHSFSLSGSQINAFLSAVLSRSTDKNNNDMGTLYMNRRRSRMSRRSSGTSSLSSCSSKDD